MVSTAATRCDPVPLPPDQSLGESVDPVLSGNVLRGDQAGQHRPNGPVGNAEQFAYPHRCAGWELGRV